MSRRQPTRMETDFTAFDTSFALDGVSACCMCVESSP